MKLDGEEVEGNPCIKNVHKCCKCNAGVKKEWRIIFRPTEFFIFTEFEALKNQLQNSS